MNISTKYSLGDFVYLKTDTEQIKHIITQIKIQPNCIIYELSFGHATSEHYELEINKELDMMIKIS